MIRKLLLATTLATLTMSTHAFNMAYVGVNENRLVNAGCYIDKQTKKPFFKIVALFAPNINGEEPNAPYIYNNPHVEATYASGDIEALHKRGIKVIASLLGNHENAGWACMTDEQAARKFADDIANYVNKYNLDGVDIDDEYSNCATNNESMIMLAQAIKQNPQFKGKLLTKALFMDYSYFTATYKGHKLSDYLDYGWEMSYGNSNFMGRLQLYLKSGMTMKHLMVGGWTIDGYPSPYDIGKFSAKNNTAGMMVFDVRDNSRDYIEQMAQGYYGKQAGVAIEQGCMRQ